MPPAAGLVENEFAMLGPQAQEGTYTIKVTNNGPQGATGVTMSDPVPAGLQPAQIMGPNCITQINIGTGQFTVFCNIGALANGAQLAIARETKVVEVVGGGAHDPESAMRVAAAPVATISGMRMLVGAARAAASISIG